MVRRVADSAAVFNPHHVAADAQRDQRRTSRKCGQRRDDGKWNPVGLDGFATHSVYLLAADALAPTEISSQRL